jgi:potassium-transporting ATPase ATP-binding subunit
MTEKKSIWTKEIISQALKGAFKKLNPFVLYRNPVMFIVELGSAMTTLVFILDLLRHRPWSFDFQISAWLWATVLFATFAEALAEGRGKAQAETLRRSRSEAAAERMKPDGSSETVPAVTLRKGDVVLASDSMIIPCDGEILEGVSLVDESAITGESAPVVRESGGDKSGVTGGTRVLSGKIRIKVTSDPGETFLDRMIRMVEGAKRTKTPNEQALEILLIGLTVLFLVVVVSLRFFCGYLNIDTPVVILVALLVCLMPTTIGGLLPAIGIAGMDRLLRHNVIAITGRAVEAAGDVNVVLLDKTGTLTLGNRMATEFMPLQEVKPDQLAQKALYASLADETPEGRSIVLLAKQVLNLHSTDIRQPEDSVFVEFSAQTRMSGINTPESRIRKGSTEAVEGYVKSAGGIWSEEAARLADTVSGDGGTPLLVADETRVYGVIRLKDIVKSGIRERLRRLQKMNIESIMITGDNPLTAVVIAAEAGVSDFIASAKPESKLKCIRDFQARGYMVAMIGDGTNDAPALAQADVAVAMNAGTQAAREAANMIDLDSSPTKLIDIVEIGKEILITRGTLTTFSVANDVSKYFAILPAIFSAAYPSLKVLNIMGLGAKSAVLSAIIFNAIIIPSLIPLALKGVGAGNSSPIILLLRNILIYGVGGLALPFLGIKLIDILLTAFKLV